MTPWLRVLVFLAGVFSWSFGLQSAPRVAFVLSRSVIVSDPIPDSNLPAPADRDALFRKKLETAYSGQILQLGPNTMISPDQRVLLLVPSITAARTTHQVKAGSIHNFESVIVGDVSAVDPWSGTILYSATRMVFGEISLGQSKINEASTEVPNAFRVTYDRWLDACIEQMKRDLEPFDLTADTLAAPEKARNSPGGIWPFGSERGVRQGATLMSPNGQLAEVTSVYPKFSAIRDIASFSRAIPAGETYSLTVVERPSSRPEPRVALSWLGLPLISPSSSGGQSISSDAALSLFANYLTRSGLCASCPNRVRYRRYRINFEPSVTMSLVIPSSSSKMPLPSNAIRSSGWPRRHPNIVSSSEFSTATWGRAPGPMDRSSTCFASPLPPPSTGERIRRNLLSIPSCRSCDTRKSLPE